MACSTCYSLDNTDVRGVCAVCEINHNDTRIKRVKYCDVCKKYICEPHRNDVISRGIAAFKNVFKKAK